MVTVINEDESGAHVLQQDMTSSESHMIYDTHLQHSRLIPDLEIEHFLNPKTACKCTSSNGSKIF